MKYQCNCGTLTPSCGKKLNGYVLHNKSATKCMILIEKKKHIPTNITALQMPAFLLELEQGKCEFN